MESYSSRRWWLAINGRADGPHVTAHVFAMAQARQIELETQACPEGGQEWRPLLAWPEFAAMQTVPSMMPPPPPGTFPPVASGSDQVLTNPRLPPMANWICIYAIVVAPIMWCIEHLSCGMTGFSLASHSEAFGLEVMLSCVNALKSFVVTVLLVIGGLRLRSLRASGPRFIRIALWVGLGLGLLIMGLVVMVVFGVPEDQWAESTPAADIINFVILIAGLAEFAFMVLALVWLTRHERKLPLMRWT